MFKFGLNKFLKPHNKLSEKYKPIEEQILQKYPSITKEDEKFKWHFEKQLPNCMISFHFELKNYEKKFLKEGGGLAKIGVFIKIFNELSHSHIAEVLEMNDLDCEKINQLLTKNSNFKEFHTYYLEIKNWNSVLQFTGEDYVTKHSIISPCIIEQTENFTLIPCLIKYNLSNNRFIKRYDFGLMIVFPFDLIEDEYGRFNQITNITFLSSTKEIKFKINPKLLAMKSRYITYKLLFDTNGEGKEIMESFEQENFQNIKLGFLWKETTDYLINAPKVNTIQNVWEIYLDLTKNLKREIKRDKEIRHSTTYPWN